ncbi:MAG: hypothetical protein GC168_17555 [Candidatus Hydrogenedens sp.]|nr:hypothetical protein [Candidatus Hydrogenedens sp.]
MATTRTEGAVHPGFRWGPFTARVPFYHTRVEWPELAQGIFVAGATGLGLVPVLMGYFGLDFDHALACIFIQSMLLSAAPILFGEPYAPGWITPALPLALTFVLAVDGTGMPVYATPEAKFQVMTAVSLQFAVLTAVLGVTGLGGWLMRNIPAALKGGIILGAAIAALKRVFIDDAEKFLHVQPITTIAAVSVCLIITFSLPLQQLRNKYPIVKFIAALGLLPGFIVAAIVGPLSGEVVFAPDFSKWIVIPPFVDAFWHVSPFGIGWPPMSMLLDPNVFILAVMGYVIWFGDIVTGTEILETARKARPDEEIDLNFNRSHQSTAIRNVLMAIFAPFFPTQGCLWTGVQVIVVQRWAAGRKGMDSLFSGISSYYVFGVPLLYVVVPLVTALQPLMGVALSLTLVLTGFACAYVAMSVTHNPIERGVALLTAVTLALFAQTPWVGMLVGIVATVALVGIERPKPPEVPESA